MDNKFTVLGIDTSNYTTSVALVDDNGKILADFRRLLSVKQGERGLRQSDAVFQHMINFPQIFEEMSDFLKIETKDLKSALKLKAIAVSERPRPVEGSYMPCFRIGEAFARTLATSLALPIFRFSHQEGHIEAALHGQEIDFPSNFLCWHLSGGTCELLLVENAYLKASKQKFTDYQDMYTNSPAYNISIIGGTLDISFGQLIDRIGVRLGIPFPSGKYLDELAYAETVSSRKFEQVFTKIKRKGLFFNISGLETQIQRYIESRIGKSENEQLTGYIASDLFEIIADLLMQVSTEALGEEKIHHILFSGGVAESSYIRKRFKESKENDKYSFGFSNAKLSSDNAVGIALLGRKLLL